MVDTACEAHILRFPQDAPLPFTQPHTYIDFVVQDPPSAGHAVGVQNRPSSDPDPNYNKTVPKSARALYEVDSDPDPDPDCDPDVAPGGPYRRTPERRRSPDANRPGWRSGSSTVSRMAALTLAKPPTSSHRTSGMEGAPICARCHLSVFPQACGQGLLLLFWDIVDFRQSVHKT
jgi:hypothetical protein